MPKNVLNLASIPSMRKFTYINFATYSVRYSRIERPLVRADGRGGNKDVRSALRGPDFAPSDLSVAC